VIFSKLRLPLPFRLDHVNCYAVKGRDGWTIVDAGLNYDPARKAWLEFMDRHGFSAGEITGIYITHYHPDHYGAAGWLQQLSGAPVHMSPTDPPWRIRYGNRAAGTRIPSPTPSPSSLYCRQRRGHH